MPSNFDEKNAIVFRGLYPGNFETKFFPSRFEGILYNSVGINKTSVLVETIAVVLPCIQAFPSSRTRKGTFKETLNHQKEKETASVHDLFTGKLVKRKRAKQAKQSFLFDIPFKVLR